LPLELFKTAGSEVCTLTLRGEEDNWRFRLENAFELVLYFMNGECQPLLSTESWQDRQRQAAYFREAFASPALVSLRDLAEHVLVCGQPRGFDPVARLAAYTYANGITDVLGFAESREPETSVVGSEAAAHMTRNWGALRKQYCAREPLFAALLEDAARQGYPFELGVCARYPSLPHLLRALVGDMIESRRLLRRCPVCKSYSMAEALPHPCACVCESAIAQQPQASANGPEIQAAALYKELYNRLANGDHQEAFQRFEAEARGWRQRIRQNRAAWEDFTAWLAGQA